MSITREEIRQLCIAHDGFMAEQASVPIEERSVSAAPSPGDLIYRRMENAQVAAPAAEPQASEGDWSGWERWLRAHLDIERERMLDGIAEATVTLIQRERVKHDREIAELRGRLDALFQLLGTGNKKLWTPP